MYRVFLLIQCGCAGRGVKKAGGFNAPEGSLSEAWVYTGDMQGTSRNREGTGVCRFDDGSIYDGEHDGDL